MKTAKLLWLAAFVLSLNFSSLVHAQTTDNPTSIDVCATLISQFGFTAIQMANYYNDPLSYKGNATLFLQKLELELKAGEKCAEYRAIQSLFTIWNKITEEVREKPCIQLIAELGNAARGMLRYYETHGEENDRAAVKKMAEKRLAQLEANAAKAGGCAEVLLTSIRLLVSTWKEKLGEEKPQKEEPQQN